MITIQDQNARYPHLKEHQGLAHMKYRLSYANLKTPQILGIWQRAYPTFLQTAVRLLQRLSFTFGYHFSFTFGHDYLLVYVTGAGPETTGELFLDLKPNKIPALLINATVDGINLVQTALITAYMETLLQVNEKMPSFYCQEGDGFFKMVREAWRVEFGRDAFEIRYEKPGFDDFEMVVDNRPEVIDPKIKYLGTLSFAELVDHVLAMKEEPTAQQELPLPARSPETEPELAVVEPPTVAITAISREQLEEVAYSTQQYAQSLTASIEEQAQLPAYNEEDALLYDELSECRHERFVSALRLLKNLNLVHLHGSHGVGKSHLARQLCEALTQPWMLVISTWMRDRVSDFYDQKEAMHQQILNFYRHGGVLIVERFDSSGNQLVDVLKLLTQPKLLLPALGSEALVNRHPEFRMIFVQSYVYLNQQRMSQAYSAELNGMSVHVGHDNALEEQLLSESDCLTAIRALREYYEKSEDYSFNLSYTVAFARLLSSGYSPLEAWDQMTACLGGDATSVITKKLATLRTTLGRSCATTQKARQRQRRRAEAEKQTELLQEQASPLAKQDHINQLVGGLVRSVNGDIVDEASGEVLTHGSTDRIGEKGALARLEDSVLQPSRFDGFPHLQGSEHFEKAS